MPTFDDLQKSEYSGRKLEFYKFSNNDHDFRYTSSTEEIEYLSAIYTPLEIVRRNITQTTNLDRGDLILTLPKTADLVREYKRTPPSPYWLTLYAVHFGETETKQLWQGRIFDVSQKGNLAEIRLESIITAQNRMGLQREFQVLCNNFLGDGIGCPVNLALRARPATVTAISADTITVSGLEAYIDEWFEGGFVELADGDRRDVVRSRQSTGILTLTRGFSNQSLAVGDPVIVYDGCKHRHLEDCVGKFGDETNNGEAFGGYPYPGGRNPFKTGVQ